MRHRGHVGHRGHGGTLRAARAGCKGQVSGNLAKLASLSCLGGGGDHGGGSLRSPGMPWAPDHAGLGRAVHGVRASDPSATGPSRAYTAEEDLHDFLRASAAQACNVVHKVVRVGAASPEGECVLWGHKRTTRRSRVDRCTGASDRALRGKFSGDTQEGRRPAANFEAATGLGSWLLFQTLAQT